MTLWVWDAPPSLERALEAVPNVDGVEWRNTYWTKWKVGEVWQDIYFIGIADFGGMEVNPDHPQGGPLSSLDWTP